MASDKRSVKLMHLIRLANELQAGMADLLGQGCPVSETPTRAEINSTVPQLVTLEQCAAMVRRQKRSLYAHKGMPEAACSFRRGQPKLYDWAVMRPWLEQEFGLVLPEIHPAHSGVF